MVKTFGIIKQSASTVFMCSFKDSGDLFLGFPHCSRFKKKLLLVVKVKLWKSVTLGNPQKTTF